MYVPHDVSGLVDEYRSLFADVDSDALVRQRYEESGCLLFRRWIRFRLSYEA